jgi:hypothetical protein
MQFTEQHRQLADTVLEFVRDEINPRVAEWEAQEAFLRTRYSRNSAR